MATSLHPESRRRYSWWWDSHISPKNSKWLQENLTDMDSKVKIMIKLIEEDADSFAKRAEMYYKKRPELMRLVEDFYRAYRALAERYDHATRALRQAHRTMAEAFPNQVPFRLADDLPSASSASEAAPHTPETLHELHPMLDPDDLHKDAQGVSSSHFHAIKRNGAYSNESDSATSKKGLKQLDELFGSGKGASNSVNFAEGRMRKGLNYNEEDKKGSKHEMHSESRERPNHMMKENKRSVQVDNSSQNSNTWIVSSSERACNDENEVQTLKDSLATLEAEKEAGLLQYQHALERLSNLEGEVSHAQEDATGFNQQACKARTEVETLNEALTKLQEEKEASLVQYQQFSERMYELEKKLSCVQEDRGNERAIEAESKAQLLKQALARVEAEKEASLLQYSQCLQKISNLESNVFLAEENARKLYERAVGAETEVQFLKESISQLHEEKEAASLQYQLSLERISNLQSELSHAQEEARRLSNVIVMGYAKLNSTEEQYLQLEKENRSLQEEIDALVEMMETQKQELSEKHEELDRLQLCIQEEAWRVNDENKILKEQNLSSASSIKNLQDEILRLSGAEMKLGKEVEVLVDQRDALQQEIYGLKEEMNGLKKQHLCVMEQMELVGLKPDSFMTSVKSLQEENSSLRETCQKDNDEKVSLLEKLNNFENLYKRNALLESCLSDANARLELLREKVKALEETCQYLRGETFTLVDEKEALISQLEVTNGNIEKLSEKNTLLETFLFDAHVERVWLRGKSKCLEDFCLSLDSEKSDLLSANEFLVSQSKGIQKKMGYLEERYTDLEEKHFGLKKELESRIHQVEDVQATLVLEKEEHANFILSSGTQLAHLKGNINALQEEGMRRMKDFEEEEDKTVKAQLEMFILQRCIQDMEEKFRALFIEYQQHLETSVLSENRVVNLGRENFEQQVKVNSLVDQVGWLRLAICQIALSLEFNPDYECQGKIEQDQILLQLAMGKIKDLKESVWTIEDEKYQLLFENSILLTLFDQLRLEEASIESERSILDTDLRLRTEELLLLQSEKNVLRNASDELNHQIGIGKDLLNQKEVKLSEAEQRLQAIEGENNELNIKLSDLNRECNETRVLKEVLEKKILNISVDNTRKDKEIECLHETTEKLELEVAKLHESIEEQRVKTDDLSSELQKKINAVELWESEAEIMYDNCQITTIHAALFKEKVYELAGACERLQNERDSKTKNVEQLIERLVALECENKGLNCNLAGYSHIMVSLRDSVTSLEDCVFRQTKDYAADNQEPEVADLASHQCDSSYKELTENQGLEGGHEVSDMLELQYRIKNIECSMVEQKRLMLQENTDKDIRLEAAMKEIQKLEQFGNESSNLRLCNTEPDFSEVGDGILVKDIPLDKVSHCSSYDHGFGPRALSRREDSVTNELIVESWETVEQGFDLDFAFNQQWKLSAVHTEEKSDCYQMEALEDKSECPSSEIQSEEVGIVSEGVMVHQGDKRKVLERLASDKQKLLNLQVTVEDLKKKVEQFERCRIPKDTEYSTVKEHLKEVEAAISQLIGTNGKLAKKAGGHSVTSNRKVAVDLEETGKGQRCRISEQARRVSEKIGRLQLEVQRIQFSLLRLEGAKGTKAADRKVLLKDYLYGIQKSRPIDKRKKRPFFSCVKPPST